MESLLKVTGITKKFQGLVAVDNVSIDMKEHTIHALIGPNGAGKTTTVNLITGVLPLTSGKVEFGGKDITGMTTHDIARQGIGRTFQNIKVFPTMTLLENVMVGGHQQAPMGMMRGIFDIRGSRAEEKRLKEKAEEVLKRIEIMVYNNPWFAGYELSVQEVKELVDDGTIQCIKAAHGDPNRVHELKYHCKDDLTVFYGHDYAAMEGLLAGADGWLSGFPAVLPKQCRRLQDACFAKDVDAAIAAQNNIQPYIDYFFYDKVNGVPHWQEICKYTLQAQGLDVGLPRKPLGELDDANKKKIEKLLADME